MVAWDVTGQGGPFSTVDQPGRKCSAPWVHGVGKCILGHVGATTCHARSRGPSLTPLPSMGFSSGPPGRTQGPNFPSWFGATGLGGRRSVRGQAVWAPRAAGVPEHCPVSGVAPTVRGRLIPDWPSTCSRTGAWGMGTGAGQCRVPPTPLVPPSRGSRVLADGLWCGVC